MCTLRIPKNTPHSVAIKGVRAKCPLKQIDEYWESIIFPIIDPLNQKDRYNFVAHHRATPGQVYWQDRVTELFVAAYQIVLGRPNVAADIQAKALAGLGDMYWEVVEAAANGTNGSGTGLYPDFEFAVSHWKQQNPNRYAEDEKTWLQFLNGCARGG